MVMSPSTASSSNMDREADPFISRVARPPHECHPQGAMTFAAVPHSIVCDEHEFFQYSLGNTLSQGSWPFAWQLSPRCLHASGRGGEPRCRFQLTPPASLFANQSSVEGLSALLGGPPPGP